MNLMPPGHVDDPLARPPVSPLPKGAPLRTFRVMVEATGRALQTGFAGELVRFEPYHAGSPAEFTSEHQAQGALEHIQRRIDQPFYAIGLKPGARLIVLPHDWIEADCAQINDCGVRVRKTAVDAAYLDVQGQPAWLSAVRRVFE